MQRRCTHVRIYEIDVYAKCVDDVDRGPIKETVVVSTGMLGSNTRLDKYHEGSYVIQSYLEAPTWIPSGGKRS